METPRNRYIAEEKELKASAHSAGPRPLPEEFERIFQAHHDIRGVRSELEDYAMQILNRIVLDHRLPLSRSGRLPSFLSQGLLIGITLLLAASARILSRTQITYSAD